MPARRLPMRLLRMQGPGRPERRRMLPRVRHRRMSGRRIWPRRVRRAGQRRTRGQGLRRRAGR